MIVAADHCFTADTPVLTPMGDKPIEQFKKGDEILSRPEDSPYAPARKSYVEEVFELSGDTLVLRVGGQSITTTEKHPFYVVGKGWVRAVELEPGDPLLGHDGKTTAVESAVSTGRQEKVYNLRVAFDRTYFVGSRGWDFSVWVHNTYTVPDKPNAQGKWVVESSQPGKGENVVQSFNTKAEAEAAAKRLRKKAAHDGIGGFRLGRHGDMPSPRLGEQSHHGAMSAWMEPHYRKYNPDNAPAVLMPEANHRATFGVYNKWRAEMKRAMGGTFDWSKVTEAQMRELSARMFKAANVPEEIRAEYWIEFQEMIDSLSH